MARRSYTERVPLVNELRWDLWDDIHAFVLEYLPNSEVTGEAETNTSNISADSYEELKNELVGESVKSVHINWNMAYANGDTWFSLYHFHGWESAVQISSREESRALGLSAALKRRIDSGALHGSPKPALESQEAPASPVPQAKAQSLVGSVGQFFSHNLVATVVGGLIVALIVYWLGFT